MGLSGCLIGSEVAKGSRCRSQAHVSTCLSSCKVPLSNPRVVWVGGKWSTPVGTMHERVPLFNSDCRSDYLYYTCLIKGEIVVCGVPCSIQSMQMRGRNRTLTF